MRKYPHSSVYCEDVQAFCALSDNRGGVNDAGSEDQRGWLGLKAAKTTCRARLQGHGPCVRLRQQSKQLPVGMGLREVALFGGFCIRVRR
jgi:hypothetical protein